MSAASIDVQAEAGQIMHLTEPYLAAADLLCRQWFGQYDLKGIVRLLEYGGTAAEIRQHLMTRADEMIAALAAEGWHLMDYLNLECTTEVRPFAQTLHGEMVIPSQQHGVTLKVDTRIGRAR